MKQRRVLLLTLLALLLVIGIPTGWFKREYRREQGSCYNKGNEIGGEIHGTATGVRRNLGGA